ncbi:unnamed protein product, partial [Heterotrigona itama]
NQKERKRRREGERHIRNKLESKFQVTQNSIHITGISSILGSLNFIVTIFMIKNFSLNYDQINLFPRSISITVILLIRSLP